jgi:diguanylate cyclase (GGDEF)-like protein
MIVSWPPGESEIFVERLSLELHRVPLRRIATTFAALERFPEQRQQQQHQQQSFDDRLQQELDAASWPRPLALCMFDVDGLRHVNERHGKQVGDRLLLEIAGCLRRGGEVFRVGDDEFALLLPARHEPRALVAAEAALERIRSLESVTGETIRVSAGLALYPTHAADRSELVRTANDALSVAKRDGTNRVHIFAPSSSPRRP